MKESIQMPDRELRASPAQLSLRMGSGLTKAEGCGVLRGYGALTGIRSINLGAASEPYFEVFAPGVFADVVGQDVRALVNHDANLILGRSRPADGHLFAWDRSLWIASDSRGLAFELSVPDTSAGRDLCESIRRGDVDQCSIAFEVSAGGERWERVKVDGKWAVVRTITKLSRLFDLSVVTYAKFETTVSLARMAAVRRDYTGSGLAFQPARKGAEP